MPVCSHETSDWDPVHTPSTACLVWETSISPATWRRSRTHRELGRYGRVAMSPPYSLSISNSLLKPSFHGMPLNHSTQCRQLVLDVIVHDAKHAIRRPMRIGWSFADIAQSYVWHRLGQVFLCHALHRAELLPERLALDIILMHSTRTIKRDLEPPDLLMLFGRTGCCLKGHWGWFG